MINELLKRIFINEMLINNLFQILKNVFDNNIMSFDKIKSVSRDN